MKRESPPIYRGECQDIVFTPERALTRDVLDDAQRFVDRAAKHLEQEGAL